MWEGFEHSGALGSIFTAKSEVWQSKRMQCFHCMWAFWPAPKNLLSSSQTLGQGHRGEGQHTREIRFSGEDALGADSWHISEHSSSWVASTFYPFFTYLLPMCHKSEAWGQLLFGWVTAIREPKQKNWAFSSPEAKALLFISQTQKCTQTPFYLFIHIVALSIPGNWCSWHSGLGHAGTGLWVTL